MPQIPRSLRKTCRKLLPLLRDNVNESRIFHDLKAILETDRWNSFDGFHRTTATLAEAYETAGALTEVHPVPTGGRIGSGRWIIHKAADVRSATLDIVRPVRERVLDYRENPFHVVQWSAATPPRGLEGDLVIVDSREDLDRIPSGGLRGKWVLTRLDPRTCLADLSDKGAVGVITDHAVARLPDAVQWTKFGWGGIPLDLSAVHVVGLVLSANGGKRLRSLAGSDGRLRVRAQVDIRHYVGAQDIVTALIPGRDDPQAEVWAIAHSAEPGALDNASGVAVTMEIARLIQGLVSDGRLPLPRRSIRLINGYECYSFFNYLENEDRFQLPLAGVNVDTVGAKAEVCGRRLEWHATIPMSAGFVDGVGEAILRATLRLLNPGYRLHVLPFTNTGDTQICDPKYGFPCPWLTTHHSRAGRGFDAYHSSADTPDLVSPEGLAVCAVAMSGYLYYLAEAATPEVLEVATCETERAVARLRQTRPRIPAGDAGYIRDQHRISMDRLQRWLWGGERSGILAHFAECERRVRGAGPRGRPARRRRAPGAGRIPRRIAPLIPALENTPAHIADRIRKTDVPAWGLYWADGRRTLAEIAEALSIEHGKQIPSLEVASFFEAHRDLGYVELIEPSDTISRGRLVADLRALGLASGMDVMLHSSLSRIGHVDGGPDTVIDAILAVIGKAGTLVMPSFNHRRAWTYNRLATTTTNGAIPQAFWRRPSVHRSAHPTHAVAALGPGAEDLCRHHVETGLWTAESPLGRFVQAGGYILSIGVTHDATTVYHVAEMSIPCGCNDPFLSTDLVVAEDGSVQKVPGLAWRSGRCPVPPGDLGRILNRRRLLRKGCVGRAPSTLAKAFDLLRIHRERLEAACPTCPITPEIYRPD